MLTLAIQLVFVICSKDITQTYGAKLGGKIKEKQNPYRKNKTVEHEITSRGNKGQISIKINKAKPANYKIKTKQKIGNEILPQTNLKKKHVL